MHLIKPNWPAPNHIKAFTTTRIGGTSHAPYDEFNLGQHVGDNPQHVLNNRVLLRAELPSEPCWLNQTHSDIAVAAIQTSEPLDADACYTQTPNVVCCVLTGDCLPILLCDITGTLVAAVHAGWRGLANGILMKTITQMNINPSHLMAWIGPAIGPCHYEIGDEVRDIFLQLDAEHETAFSLKKERWFANLPAIAHRQLTTAGIPLVTGGDHCTFSHPDLFYSYRRDGTTGRMATCIWIAIPLANEDAIY